MAELIVALDTPKPEDALKLVGQLSPCTSWFKIGLELFVSAGTTLITSLKELFPAISIFLDLKFYDIPNTAAHAAEAACRWGVNMLTIHCQGGEAMCKAVMEALSVHTPRPLVMGVTALTSFRTGQMPGICLTPGEYGKQLANYASNWGLDGVICSPREVTQIKSAHPELLCVCPGIRPRGSAQDDQARILTPAQAIAAGADFLVIGRPITKAEDPFLAARRIMAEAQL